MFSPEPLPAGLNRVTLSELRQVVRDDLVGVVENALVSMEMGRSASGGMGIGECEGRSASGGMGIGECEGRLTSVNVRPPT